MTIVILYVCTTLLARTTELYEGLHAAVASMEEEKVDQTDFANLQTMNGKKLAETQQLVAGQMQELMNFRELVQ